MNKKLALKIPITKDIKDTEADKAFLKLNINTMLNPFFISESSLVSMFVDEEDYDKYRDKSREIIFNASLRALEFTYGKLLGFSPEHKLILKRELALCFAINAFSKHFYKGFVTHNQRSKSFAEFSVSTTIKNDPQLLKESIDNSNNCIEEAKSAIVDLSDLMNSIGQTHVKGAFNSGNSFSYRLWFNSNLPEKSRALFASDKIWYEGNIYKDGVSTNVSNTGINYNGRNI